MLGLGVAVLAKLLWDSLNWRPTPVVSEAQEGFTYTTPDNLDALFVFTINNRGDTTPQVNCANGASNPGSVTNSGPIVISVTGKSFTITKTSRFTRFDCDGTYADSVFGENSQFIHVQNAAGNWQQVAGMPGNYHYKGAGIAYTSTTTYSLLGVTANGQNIPTGSSSTPVVPAEVRPRPPESVPAAEASTAPALAVPVSPALPATVPDSAPAPAPASAPGGLPAGRPATPPDAATVPNIVRTVTTSSPGSQTQPITAGGVSQAPAAPIVPTTPAEAVLIGSQLVGGPGSSPPQSPGGTAAELGRLEGKSELTLSKLSQLAPLLESIDVLQALGEWLLSANGGVTYTLQPPCGTDANGDPLPPVEVVVPPTIGVEVATLARLDALAMLIDEHKQMRQPICKGKPTGSPVTVTGVEVE